MRRSRLLVTHTVVAPSLPAEGTTCGLAGIIARCAATGEISFIDGGARHKFTGDVYQMYGAPLIQVDEKEECELMLSCPVAGLVPEPAKPGKCWHGAKHSSREIQRSRLVSYVVGVAAIQI